LATPLATFCKFRPVGCNFLRYCVEEPMDAAIFRSRFQAVPLLAKWTEQESSFVAPSDPDCRTH
jgi:hypothetical protein